MFYFYFNFHFKRAVNTKTKESIDDYHIIRFYLYHVISIGRPHLTATSDLIRNTFDYRFCMYTY